LNQKIIATILFFISLHCFAASNPIETTQVGNFDCRNVEEIAKDSLHRQCQPSSQRLNDFRVFNCVAADKDDGNVEYYSLLAGGSCTSEKSAAILMPLVENFLMKFAYEKIGGDALLWNCQPLWDEFEAMDMTFSVTSQCQILGDMYNNKNVQFLGHSDGEYVFIDSIHLSDVPL
jgi:hypothetical protein